MKILYVKSKNGLVPANQKSFDEHGQIVNGSLVECKAYQQRQRSLQQLNLYWKCCQLVADNTDLDGYDTKEIISERLKMALKFIDFSFIAKDGSVHFKTKSISFDNCNTDEANKYFTEAFELMAELLKCTISELQDNAQQNYQVQEIVETFKGEVVK